MNAVRMILACGLALSAAACTETAHYLFGGDRYAVTHRGQGRVTVSNLNTGIMVEESESGPGPFAERLEREGQKQLDTATDGDVILSRQPPPRLPGPVVRRPPPNQSPYLGATRDIGGE